MLRADPMPPAADIEEFLARDESKELLRFSTAGSVDDGKSTLIGRLLYDSRAVYEDQLDAVRRSPVNRSSGPIDLSLLTDGLRAEREQGITIDVAYRYFATPRRKFIIADTPGHEQYTRNMATGASTADLAILLVDVRNGVLPQSRRHAFIAAMLGIPRIVVAVNKMDLADFREDAFEDVRAELEQHLARLGVRGAHFLPVSALDGDNVITRSPRTPWYKGVSLLEYLETVPLDHRTAEGPLRLPVQYVIRPDADFRGYAGQVAQGGVRAGDPVLALPSGRVSRVKSIVSAEGDLDEAFAPMPATLCLEDELDISRGDMLVDPRRLPHVSRTFEAMAVWMSPEQLRLDRPYLIKHTTQQLTAKITAVQYRVDVISLEQTPADALRLNEIGRLAFEATRPLFFDAYADNRSTGGLIVIDPITNATVAAAMIEAPRVTDDAAERSHLLMLAQEFRTDRVTPAERYAHAGHYPATIWLDGRRQGLAHLLERRLFDRGLRVHAIAGAARSPSPAETAELLTALGVIAIFALAEPDAAEADGIRARIGDERFFPFDVEALPASDHDAADRICALLEQRSIVPARIFEDKDGI